MKDKQLRKEFEELRREIFGNSIYESVEAPESDYSFWRRFLKLENRVNKLEQIHPCSNCKALFRIEDLQRIEENLSMGIPENPKRWKDWGIVNHFYCPSHKVPYDRIQDGKYYKDNVEIKLKK